MPTRFPEKVVDDLGCRLCLAFCLVINMKRDVQA